VFIDFYTIDACFLRLLFVVVSISPLMGHTFMLVNAIVVYRYQLAAFLLPHISPHFPTQQQKKQKQNDETHKI
jgi:hypothetical protein